MEIYKDLSSPASKQFQELSEKASQHRSTHGVPTNIRYSEMGHDFFNHQKEYVKA